MISFVIGLVAGPYGDLVLVAYSLAMGAICTFADVLVERKSGKR